MVALFWWVDYDFGFLWCFLVFMVVYWIDCLVFCLFRLGFGCDYCLVALVTGFWLMLMVCVVWFVVMVLITGLVVCCYGLPW